jgi:hypothetical protein
VGRAAQTDLRGNCRFDPKYRSARASPHQFQLWVVRSVWRVWSSSHGPLLQVKTRAQERGGGTGGYLTGGLAGLEEEASDAALDQVNFAVCCTLDQETDMWWDLSAGQGDGGVAHKSARPAGKYSSRFYLLY